jgi:hypothetical protein
MKIGDIIEVNGGYMALIIGVELIYPNHPQSPARNYEVQFIGPGRPRHVPLCDHRANLYLLHAPAAKRVISHV